eukprot:324463-Chlamydomonas_euryale.AAC.4
MSHGARADSDELLDGTMAAYSGGGGGSYSRPGTASQGGEPWAPAGWVKKGNEWPQIGLVQGAGHDR